MIPTHVIILSQGKQTRLSGFQVAKQVLPLPMHVAAGVDNFQIMQRTVAQVARILSGDSEATIDHAYRTWQSHRVTIVGWAAIERALLPSRIPYLRSGEDDIEYADLVIYPSFYHLGDPGNSSLVGIARYLQGCDQSATYTRTVVLLGDVVYSWGCLASLFRGPERGDVTFAGTPELDLERGELWGVAWYRSTEKLLRRALDEALTRASKGDEDVYQPGQLRNWLWALDALMNKDVPMAPNPKGRKFPPIYNHHQGVRRDWWVPIDDYTMDVDVPDHLIDLARASLQAYADDREQGLIRRG